jgi:chromosomal replication initiation ATPase DnaA
MKKISETVLSGKYSTDTCIHLIDAIGNVSSDAKTAMEFFETIDELYTKQNPH